MSAKENGIQDILEELRSIRTLLMMDKKDELEALGRNIKKDQRRILEKLSYSNWVKSSEIKEEITQEFDYSGKTFERRMSDLEQKGLVEKEGQKSGTQYRKTGLVRMALTLAE